VLAHFRDLRADYLNNLMGEDDVPSIYRTQGKTNLLTEFAGPLYPEALLVKARQVDRNE
jgi:hypothetical protein